MTLEEKIAQTPKLERIDSSIDSCIKILQQELERRITETPEDEGYINGMMGSLYRFKNSFNIMRGKK